MTFEEKIRWERREERAEVLAELQPIIDKKDEEIKQQKLELSQKDIELKSAFEEIERLKTGK